MPEPTYDKKDRRLVMVPAEVREIVNTLAGRSGTTFEIKAGELLESAARAAYAEFIRSEASRLPGKAKPRK